MSVVPRIWAVATRLPALFSFEVVPGTSSYDLTSVTWASIMALSGLVGWSIRT